MESAATGLTDQQRAAVVQRETSVVLSSGAGCGKTHVLTQRYLSHLQEDVEVGQLVAITFTERAARQMRDRIRRAVVGYLRTSSGEAAERWARRLQGLETAPITTIHSFCATLLRQNAVEAGLDPRFDVLEDVLAVNLESDALVGALQRLLTTPGQSGEDLHHLVLLYGWRTVIEGVQHLIRTWEPTAAEAWANRSIDECVAHWREQVRKVLLPRHVEHLRTASPKIAECLRLLRRRPPKPGTQMADNVRILEEELPRLAEAADLSDAVKRLNEAAKVGRHGVKAWDADDYEAAKAALEGFRDELKARKIELLDPQQDGLDAAVEIGQRFVRVSAEAARAYRDLKRQHSVADFQDLLLLARDLLRSGPEVRERLQERYRFLLIDELQDTDPVQMEVVELLCGGGMTVGKLFAVGDASQSIYRFRGAEVSLFRRLRDSMAHEGRLALTLNFRSQPAILEFTNVLLGHRLQAYEPLRPHRPQTNPEPCVEFLWSVREAGDSVTEARRREADTIAGRIAALVGGQTLVAQKGEDGERLRAVRPGDVVLLFRSMSNVAHYEAALRHWGLDYYLVGGRAFFAQQEIYDILNLLRALDNPQDSIALAGALRSPFCCLSDEALFVLSGRGEQRSSPARGLWAGLHDEEACGRLSSDQRVIAERARRHLDRWRTLKDQLPISRLLNAVFADSGYDAATQFEFLGDRRLANLWKLVDLARTFDRSGLFGLAEFVQRLGDLVKNQPREEQAATQPENADVVRLMTIHQAKGLEFPVVFLPDVAATVGGGAPPVVHWDPVFGCVARPPTEEDEPAFSEFGWRAWRAAESIDEWNEDLRTLYVACTRAEDYLVLSGSLPESFTPTNPWTLALAERFDLRTGRCFAAELAEERRPRVRVGPVAAPSEVVEVSRRPTASRSEPLLGPSCPQIVPVRLVGPRVLPVTVVEQFLRRGVLTPFQLAPQFGAEDGSDRNEWPESVELPESFVLGSGTPIQRNVEFVLDWRELLGEDAPAIALSGSIDVCWENTEGVHAMLLHNGQQDSEDPWCGRKPSLVLTALAIQQRTGKLPRRVGLLLTTTGKQTFLRGKPLSHRTTLEEMNGAIRELLTYSWAGTGCGRVS